MGVGVTVAVGVNVGVGMGVGASVGTRVGVKVAEGAGVYVGVGIDVGSGVADEAQPPTMKHVAKSPCHRFISNSPSVCLYLYLISLSTEEEACAGQYKTPYRLTSTRARAFEQLPFGCSKVRLPEASVSRLT